MVVKRSHLLSLALASLLGSVAPLLSASDAVAAPAALKDRQQDKKITALTKTVTAHTADLASSKNDIASLSALTGSLKSQTNAIITSLGATVRLDGSLQISSTKGEKGDKGDTGAPGAAGVAGPKGDTGLAGAKGDKGDKGETGAQGIQGVQGVAGLKGDKGDKGETGPQGPSGQLPSSKYFASTGTCTTVSLEECSEDAGFGCTLKFSYFNKTTDRAIGSNAEIRMQSPTLQGEQGRRYVTVVDGTSLISETVLGLGGTAATLYTPWNIVYLQNHRSGCPGGYTSPAQANSAVATSPYTDPLTLTLRAPAGWDVALKVTKN